MMSTILGVLSTVSLCFCVYLSYQNAGDIPDRYGATVFLLMLMAFAGLGLGIWSTTEKDKYRIFTILGILFNVLALAVVSVILGAGAYQI